MSYSADLAREYEKEIAKLHERNSTLASQTIKQQEYIDLLENQVIASTTGPDEPTDYEKALVAEVERLSALLAATEDEPRPTPNLDALFAEPTKWADRPIPFLPVDPEEQRRRGTTAADGSRAMIYRSNP